MNDNEQVLTQRENELKRREQEAARNEKNIGKREEALDRRERSLSFWKRLLWLFFLLNAALLALILYMGWPAFEKIAHHGEPQEAVQMASKVDKQASDLLASVEGDSRLGKFAKANGEAWEAIDFAVDEQAVASSYHGMLLPVKRGTLLVNPAQVKERIREIANENTIKLLKDRKEFRFDLRDNGIWDNSQIIRKPCFSLEELSPGKGSYDYENAKSQLSHVLSEAEKKQGDRYGYIRFFFKTSLEGVSVMRAYSLDSMKSPTDYFAIESWSKYKAAENFPEKVEERSKYDGNFRALSFSFLREAPSSVEETLDSCLDEFFSQLLSGKE